MQGILETMSQVFLSVKQEGSYYILMAAGLYVLYRVSAKRYQWYIYYILLTQILVVANPLIVGTLSKAFPVLGTYTTFMLFTPVLLVIPFAAGELFEKAKDEKQCRLWMLLMIIVIGLSGNLYGGYTNNSEITYGKEQESVIETLAELQETQEVLVVADESILPFIRTKTPKIKTLYGRDLYQPGMDLGIVDGYSEEIMSLYEAMKNPEDTIEDALAMADLYGCNVAVVKRFSDAPKKVGHFKQEALLESYIIYTIKQ